MNLVLLVVKNDKVAQTIIGACHDRGAETKRLDNLAAALTALGSPGTSEVPDETQDAPEPGAAAQAGAPAGALILDMSEFNTKSDKKINQALAEISQKTVILGLGSNYDLKSVTSFFRSGLSDYLNLPIDPIELTRALNKVLGSLSQTPQGPNAGTPKAPHRAAKSASTKTDPGSSAATTATGQSSHGAGHNASHGISHRAGHSSGHGNDRGEGTESAFYPIVGQDPGLMEIFRIVEKVAATDSTVMIHG
ncbi:MAG: hypothetical protein LBJ61_09615, partial [Deltaproteobacteria bacterium]|nr:hypothetical protein [Deltaproteobacteria bacterium]